MAPAGPSSVISNKGKPALAIRAIGDREALETDQYFIIVLLGAAI